MSTEEAEEEPQYNADDDDDNALTSRQAYCLYLSHSLSMWNSRMYEYGVIIFIQSAFPGNLLASSINGIAETVCVLLFSSALGRWVDRSSRLHALLLSITTNRITVLISCLTWLLILSSTNYTFKHILFAFALAFSMVEKLSRITNILSMERDWVPTIANPCADANNVTPYGLTHLNTVMRRIDMLCKLIAPLAVSALISTAGSDRIAVTVVAVFSALSWGLECWSVRKVWNENSRLRSPKGISEITSDAPSTAQGSTSQFELDLNSDAKMPGLLFSTLTYIRGTMHTEIDGLRYFFSTSVWIPSVCAAIPHASVLTFSGTLITYLLNTGFSLNMVTIARFIGALFEIGSTFVYPWGIRILSGTRHAPGRHDAGEYRKVDGHDSSSSRGLNGDGVESGYMGVEHNMLRPELGVVRVGLWGIYGLLLNLIPTVFALFRLDALLSTSSETTSALPLSAFVLCLFLSISLLGRWTYDLSATQLTQTLIPASHRSSFGGTDMSIVSVLSLGHWVAAGVWHTQRDFKWLALGSLILVAVGVGVYHIWSRPWRLGERQVIPSEAFEID